MDWLTVAEIAARLGVSRQRVHQLLRARGVPTGRVGPVVVVEAQHLARLARRAGGRPRRVTLTSSPA